MHVGIDARLLAMPLTGIGRYTAELSRALIAQADVGGSGAALPDRFYLYMPGPPLTGDWAVAQVRLRAGRVRGGRAARMLWSQTVMPWQAARDGVDVFWGTSHRLPRFLPAHVARVVTIHDLVWRHAGGTMRPLSRWMEQRLMPQALHMADRIVADSQSTADDLAEAFPTVRERVRVVHLGATPMPAPADRAALTSRGIVKPYVLFVGTLEPRKTCAACSAPGAGLPRGAAKACRWCGVQQLLRPHVFFARGAVLGGEDCLLFGQNASFCARKPRGATLTRRRSQTLATDTAAAFDLTARMWV